MSLAKRYDPTQTEPELQAFWQASGIYHYDPDSSAPLYAIDTPPPTVSGHLHLGHVYSYSHQDIMARFHRMNGYNVFYPMGYDDNGLPTERLVERETKTYAATVGRQKFIEMCLETGEKVEEAYRALWQRLGMSIDWRHTYRTIDTLARKTSQWSFLDLYHKGLTYRKQAPTIWCPECQTAIAQAELENLERETQFYTVSFALENSASLAIATTRPELLPACVAIFVHPEDQRYQNLIGTQASVPLFGQKVTILADDKADPAKGTGAVMCCTFGDTDDIAWWHTHQLPLIEAIGRDGKLTSAAGQFSGLSISEARRQMVQTLQDQGVLIDQQAVTQFVRVHERCDTPVEFIVTKQWFVRLLDHKETWRKAGEQIEWYPPQMRNRYMEWVENLNWDWCISRQRYFGVAFPVWYCQECGEIMLAEHEQLPVDPLAHQPTAPCRCGSTTFTPETDVMDTWATSSVSPQIAAEFLRNPELYQKLFPMSVRPQSHEIIRTWAFYTIVKSHYHFGMLPWKAVAISGWGLAPEGMGKISKSRGGGPVAPMKIIEDYSADAVRYWAASTGLGKDAVISVEKVQTGAKLVTKLWNVARFAEVFIEHYQVPAETPTLTPADRWILARLQQVIGNATSSFQQYDYAAAKSDVETFFWRDLTDNYLEMAKQRLYNTDHASREGARYALYQVLIATVKLFAPFLPYITEKIYQELFREQDGAKSLHLSRWPQVDERFASDESLSVGEMLIEVATAVRRYKSDHQLSLMTEIKRLQIVGQTELARHLHEAEADLMSVTRASRVEVVAMLDETLIPVQANGMVKIAVEIN